MKTTIKKQIIEATENNYTVLLEATERLAHNWQYLIIWNGKTNKYMAAWKRTKELSFEDFLEFDTYNKAKTEICKAIL